jgi:tripartite ATP-independent transporter DctM subunit
MDVVGPYLLLPLFILLTIGVPISFSMGLSAALFLLLINVPGIDLVARPIPVNLFVNTMFDSVGQFAMLALPMFILSGEIMHRCNIVDDLIRLARTTMGWVRGGLAHVTIFACAMFAFISGSALATAAAIGPQMIPSMIKEKYPNDFAGALLSAAALLGPIIPPSTFMIILGGNLGISIGGLFASGIIPGFMIAFGLMAVAFYFSKKHGYGEKHPFEGVGAISRSIWRAGPALSAPLFLVLGIVGGVFTPTEAGAITVFYSMGLGAFYYRSLTWDKLITSLYQTAKVTAQIMFIVACALAFSRILSYFQIPLLMRNWMLGLTDSPFLLGLIIIGVLLFMGTFMDELSNLIILGPLLMPICTAADGLGMEKIQYGLFMVVGILLGMLTPPLGLLLNVASSISKASMERLSMVVLPFLAVEVAVLGLIAYVKPVSMFLPRLLGY